MYAEPSRRIVHRTALLAFSIVSLAGCSKPSSEPSGNRLEPAATAATAPARPPALIRVQNVRQEEIAPRLLAVGTVRPRHVSIIASAADGVVDEFPVEEGSFVKAGTVLSRLRMFSTELALDEERAVLKEREAMYQQTLQPRKENVEEAQAIQLTAEASHLNASRRLKELQSLVSRGAANQSAVDDAQDAFAETTHRLNAAKAIFRRVSAGTREEEKQQAKARLQAQQKHVAWLEAEKGKRTTTAPFDGFIVKESSYLGQWLSKGDPVVSLAMLDNVDVEVPVDQNFISQISPGSEVRLKVAGTPDLDSSDRRWTGTVRSIVPRSDWEAGSRSFPVIVRVKNKMTGTTDSPVPALREGMMAEVEFFGTPLQATMVPKDSLVRTSRGTFVFAVNPPAEDQARSVRQVIVEPGISQAGWIQVSHTELTETDAVVTEGAERLRPFQSVTLMEQSEQEQAGPPKK